ncbi:hypothetical protein ACFWDQ_00925 [Streptomyces sp. NPDC060053]|uniref:hypothetical protein n=1 Tax=Streptomyces sp. NPDC060053 TaxID=3347047 RepID=UPI003677673D
MLYVLASRPVPRAAAWRTWRISPVARDTIVPRAISTDERAAPPSRTSCSSACRRVVAPIGPTCGIKI